MSPVRQNNKDKLGDIPSLSQRVREAREACGWSHGRLAERVGIHRVSILRIESGESARPAADILQRLAVELELDEADLLALAGYRIPERLPALPAYLRAKYRMPEEATREMTAYFAFLSERYGITEAENETDRSRRSARDDKSRAA